jgi:CRISPR-associated protein Cas2
MQRYRYLVAYDVSDPKRLAKTRNCLKGFGNAMQYSVFVCDLDRAEKASMEHALLRVIEPGIDRVAIVRLGLGGDDVPFEFLGPPPALPVDGPLVY